MGLQDRGLHDTSSCSRGEALLLSFPALGQMARGGRIGSNLESITSKPELLIYSAAHAGPYITNYRYLYVVPNRPSCFRTFNMAQKSLAAQNYQVCPYHMYNTYVEGAMS